MSDSTTLLRAALHQRGQRVTPQRLAIHAVVGDLDRRHVTVDEVFALAGRRVPGISLPTVYATLELLEDIGLVRRVATEGGATVYDTRTDAHHHVACRRCGAIVDVDAPVDSAELLRAAEAMGFTPDGTQVVVRGVCAACAAAARAA